MNKDISNLDSQANINSQIQDTYISSIPNAKSYEEKKSSINNDQSNTKLDENDKNDKNEGLVGTYDPQDALNAGESEIKEVIGSQSYQIKQEPLRVQLNTAIQQQFLENQKNNQGTQFGHTNSYQVTYLIEILKNNSKEFLLKKKWIVNKIQSVILAKIQQTQGKYYDSKDLFVNIKFIDKINKNCYPYMGTLAATISQNFSKKMPKDQQIPFFELYPEQRAFFIAQPQDITNRKNAEQVYRMLIHLEPVKDQSLIQIVEHQPSKKQEFYKIGNIGQGCFGLVTLIRSKLHNKIFALKRVRLGYTPEYGQNLQFDPKLDKDCYQDQTSKLEKFINDKMIGLKSLDDTNTYSSYNNPMREVKFLKKTEKVDEFNKFVRLYKIYLIQEYDKWSQEQRKFLYMKMDYFGGINYGKSTIDSYFKEVGDHQDLGYEENTVSKITSQLFLDILDRTQDIHKLNIGIRDLHPNNIVIQRKYDKFDVRIIDFGLSANALQEKGSLPGNHGTIFKNPEITENNYQQKQYKIQYDFYSLGMLLDYLVEAYLYKFCDGDLDKVKSIYQKMFFYNANQNLKKLLLSPIDSQQLPESIQDLKEQDIFNEWKKVHKL